MLSLAPVAPERIGGRYRVDRLLSRGGMGAVYRVFDESSGRSIALKRLLAGRGDAPSTRMFEREFQTLAELRHPRIIDVYEYGVDASGPYFTMELLEGAELRELAPLPYRTACRYVRDIASSLGLLHARQLMHRDVSPRNVKLTRAGLAKLIDFGALATFGLTEQVIGTPPCIAPEVLLGVPLDQRADLYSLGAVLYWSLTGRHAFPAGEVDDLWVAWRHRPPKPSSLAPDVPSRLDDLALSLLSYDALARPASASEVIQRLEALAELEGDDDPEQSQSFLASSPLVGREAEVTHLRRRVQQSLAGEGGTVVIEGAAGVGKSRLLATSMIEGRLTGMVVVRAAAREHAGPFGVVRALCLAALHVAPDLAERALAPRVARLLHVVPELRERFPGAALEALPDDPVERRLRIQDAFVASFTDLATGHALLVVVDDVQRADPASVEAVTLLARESLTRPMLLVATVRTGEEPAATAALPWLRKAGASMNLSGLSPVDTEVLVRAFFGGAPHAGRLARWMQGMTGGNPSQLTDVALHLLRKGIVRYAKGVWTLPSDTGDADLPSTVEQARRDRFSSLNDGARALAEQLSVHRGPLHVDLCVLIAGTLDGGAQRPLDELVARGVLARVGDRYAFADESLRETLWRHLDSGRRRALHLRLGEALIRAVPDADAALDAGWHLLHGGELRRGAALLQDAATRMAWAGDDLQAAAVPLEAALDAYAVQGRAPEDCPDILIPLVVGGQAFDRRIVDRHGRAAFTAVRRISGLETAARLRPYLGERGSLVAGLSLAAARFALRPKRERRQGVRATIVGSLSAAVALVASATSRFDALEVERLVAGIAPLRAFPPGHVGRFIHDFCDALLEVSHGRDARGRKKLAVLLEQMDRPAGLRGLPGAARVQFKAGVLLLLGVGDTQLGAGLERASEIEGLGLSAYRPAVEQLRALHHAHRGRMDLAERHVARYETKAAGRVTSQLEATMPQTLAVIHRLTGDVVALRGTIEQLGELAEDLPALGWYRDLSKAAWHASLGELDASARLFEHILETRARLECPGWLPALGLYAGVLNAQGRHEQARATCARVFDKVGGDDLREYTFHLVPRRELALAYAGLGQTAAAAAQLESLIEESERDPNPLSCGLLRRDRAELALKLGERSSFEHHFESMNAWFRSTRNPALVAQCERLASGSSNRPRAGAPSPAAAVARGSESFETTIPRARSRN